MSGNPNPYHNIANWIFLGNNPLLPYQQEQKQPPPDEQKWMGMPIAPPPAPEEYKGQPEQKTDYVPPQMNVQLVPYGFNPFNNNGGGGNIGGGGGGGRVPASSRNLFGAKNGAMIFPMKGYPQNPRGLPYELMTEKIEIDQRSNGGFTFRNLPRDVERYLMSFASPEVRMEWRGYTRLPDAIRNELRQRFLEANPPPAIVQMVNQAEQAIHNRQGNIDLNLDQLRRGGMVVNKRFLGGDNNSEGSRVFRSYENSHLRNHPNWARFENEYTSSSYDRVLSANDVREMALEYFHDVLGDEKEEKGDEKDAKEEEKTTQDNSYGYESHPTGEGDDEYQRWLRKPPAGKRGRVIKRSNGGLTAEEAYYRYTGAPRIQPPPVWEPNGWGGGRYVFRSNGGLMTQDDLAQYYPYFDKNFSRLPNYQDFLDALNNLNAKRKLTERSLSKLISKFFED